MSAPRMERWMQTGSGGTMVAARAESAASLATARLLDAHRAHLRHGQGCPDCTGTDEHCDTGEALWVAYQQALNTQPQRRTAPSQPRPIKPPFRPAPPLDRSSGRNGSASAVAASLHQEE